MKNSILGDNSITSSPREEQEINETESDYLILSFYIRAATNGDPYKLNNQAPCEWLERVADQIGITFTSASHCVVVHAEHNEHKVMQQQQQHKRELHNTWSIIAIVASAIDYYSLLQSQPASHCLVTSSTYIDILLRTYSSHRTFLYLFTNHQSIIIIIIMENNNMYPFIDRDSIVKIGRTFFTRS